MNAQPAGTVIITNAEVVTGNCPGCRRGHLRRNFTCCGWLCAIFFFPIGILFCICLSDRKCNYCGGTF